MLSEFLGLFKEVFEYIWPFRIVHEWESGGFYVCGRWWKAVGSRDGLFRTGLFIIIPWFFHIEVVSLAPHPIQCARGDITLSDNSILSFDATATAHVTDVYKALNEIEDYQHSTGLLLGSVLAEKLAEVDATRLAPDKRKRLFSDLGKWVNAETSQYGVELTDVRFTSFVLNLRTYRLLTDLPLPSQAAFQK